MNLAKRYLIGINNVLFCIRHGYFQYIMLRAAPSLYGVYLKIRYKDEIYAYAHIQKIIYQVLSARDPKVACVGSFDEHENYNYEEYLLKYFKGDRGLALDFGCGMGRMIRRMGRIFERVDGVDISEHNLKCAMEYCSESIQQPNLYLSNGIIFPQIEDNTYDIAYSTIAVQHIPVHSTRMLILSELYRILKPGSHLAIQMTYIDNIRNHQKYIDSAADMKPKTGIAAWHENATWAMTTNSGYDVIIDTRL